MKSKDILLILKRGKRLFGKQYKVYKLALFGSYARGEETEDSDIDILVEFEEPVGMEFIELANELEQILHKKVDLVSRNGIKPRYFKQIEKELIYI